MDPEFAKTNVVMQLCLKCARRFETSLSGNEWSCFALSSGQREGWSHFIRRCHFFLSFVL